jgi:glucose/arabinose dehydrogenase
MDAPPRASGYKGLKGWFFTRYQKKAGGAVRSPNRITLLRDADGDGVAETRSVLLSNLTSPFGMALVGDVLYVANSGALVRFPYSEGQTQITASATKVTDFPPGPLNHHWTKSLIASADGTKLYVGIGSNSNVAEQAMRAKLVSVVRCEARRFPREDPAHPDDDAIAARRAVNWRGRPLRPGVRETATASPGLP